MPHAKIVFYGRQTLEPTPASHDFQRIITADRLHLGTESENGPGRPSKREIIYYDTRRQVCFY